MATPKSEVPQRSFMDDPNIQWMDGKPNYSVVNEKYLREKKMSHKAGSLEKIVEDLVKTWEMESSHKVNAKDWKSVDKGDFVISSNGGKKFNLEDNINIGNYNMLLFDSPLYKASDETNASSHKLFREAFKNGFAWEVLEVYSGPPVVSFTWRHWGKWEGPYRDTPPTGESIEMSGSCVARVTADLKIQSIEVFYDPNPMMATLMNFKLPNKCPHAQSFK